MESITTTEKGGGVPLLSCSMVNLNVNCAERTKESNTTTTKKSAVVFAILVPE